MGSVRLHRGDVVGTGSHLGSQDLSEARGGIRGKTVSSWERKNRRHTQRGAREGRVQECRAGRKCRWGSGWSPRKLPCQRLHDQRDGWESWPSWEGWLTEERPEMGYYHSLNSVLNSVIINLFIKSERWWAVSSRDLPQRGDVSLQHFYVLSKEKTAFPLRHMQTLQSRVGLFDDFFRLSWKASCSPFKAV